MMTVKGQPSPRSKESGWKIDRHIPIAVLIAILVQTGTFIWFVAKLDGRVDSLEELRPRLLAVETSTTELKVVTGKFDEQLKSYGRQLNRIENVADRLIGPPP